LNMKAAHRLFAQAAKSSDPQRESYARLSAATAGQKIQFNALYVPLH
jgi:hypothetical protein